MFVRSVFVGLLLMFSTSTVSAQTLLPLAPEDADCKSVLNQYEVDGKIPNKQEIAQGQATEAANNYDSIAGDIDMLMQCGPQSVDPDSAECQAHNQKVEEAKEAAEKAEQEAQATSAADDLSILLGCAIKTGRISLSMIPHFISFMANWMLGLVGIIAVLFIVLGGYMYIYGGLTDDKEKGKKYIFHALMGMSLALLAWVIVTIIISAITSPPI